MANRYTVVGFAMVLAGAVLPFLMVIGVLPSTLWLGFVSYASSMGGLLLGLGGMASYLSLRCRAREDESLDGH